MFRHIFYYRLRALLRAKEAMFWNLLFPIVLGVLFHFTFTNILEGEGFEPVDIGIVNTGGYANEAVFFTALRSVSEIDGKLTAADEEGVMLKVTAVDEGRAEELLSEGKIKGYIILGDEIELVVDKSGYEATIIKSFLDYYVQRVSTIETLMKESQGSVSADRLAKELQTENYVRELKVSEEAPDLVSNYFYTLLAMACMFSAMSGVTEITGIQANQSPLAARLNIVPAHKMKIFLGSAAALAVLQIAVITVVFAFLALVLRVDFGSDYLLVMFTNAVGAVTGIFFGTAIGALLKGSESLKSGISTAVVMLGCYLAGMMDVQMRYVVQTKVPLMAAVNPVGRLTDAYYSLYYYDTHTRYWQNMAALGTMALVFMAVTFAVLRRQRYESV